MSTSIEKPKSTTHGYVTAQSGAGASHRAEVYTKAICISHPGRHIIPPCITPTPWVHDLLHLTPCPPRHPLSCTNPTPRLHIMIHPTPCPHVLMTHHTLATTSPRSAFTLHPACTSSHPPTLPITSPPPPFMHPSHRLRQPLQGARPPRLIFVQQESAVFVSAPLGSSSPSTKNHYHAADINQGKARPSTGLPATPALDKVPNYLKGAYPRGWRRSTAHERKNLEE